MNAITINKYLLYRIGIRIVLAEQSSNTRQQVPMQTSSYFMMFEIGRTSCRVQCVRRSWGIDYTNPSTTSTAFSILYSNQIEQMIDV